MSNWEISPASSWMPNLVNPHPNSWVAFIASMFRVMAYVILTPIILFTVTDITAWAIARTLGADLDIDPQTDSTANQKPKEAPVAVPVTVDTKTEIQDKEQENKIPRIELPPSLPTFATDLRFTTPTDANYELSGLFSPPISRAGSPGISSSSRRHRSSSTSLSAAGSDSEGPSGESRLSMRSGLGMTPMDQSLRTPEGGVARRRVSRSGSDS
ncbi:transmembrane protein [Ceratobasidium theobromae]|uniref:Transmembrane protein n=1 Tax=Ceratobasidium theobromae TaxID=1582974 RepID=A0A5N5QVD2_9AGAM|nr:transmembrane protein [Ceratobasidium theobromae]